MYIIKLITEDKHFKGSFIISILQLKTIYNLSSNT